MLLLLLLNFIIIIIKILFYLNKTSLIQNKSSARKNEQVFHLGRMFEQQEKIIHQHLKWNEIMSEEEMKPEKHRNKNIYLNIFFFW